MSVESLLSEVKMVPYFAQQQRLKAAEEALSSGACADKTREQQRSQVCELMAAELTAIRKGSEVLASKVAALRNRNVMIHSELAEITSLLEQYQLQRVSPIAIDLCSVQSVDIAFNKI